MQHLPSADLADHSVDPGQLNASGCAECRMHWWLCTIYWRLCRMHWWLCRVHRGLGKMHCWLCREHWWLCVMYWWLRRMDTRGGSARRVAALLVAVVGAAVERSLPLSPGNQGCSLQVRQLAGDGCQPGCQRAGDGCQPGFQRAGDGCQPGCQRDDGCQPCCCL